MELVWADPRTLTPHPHNYRTHPRHQRKALATGLLRLGWVTPLVMNRRTGRLLDGHLRREQAIERNLEEVPVIVLDLDEDQEVAALGMIDRIAQMATVDADMETYVAEATRDLDEEMAQLLYGEPEDGPQRAAQKAREGVNEDKLNIGLVPGEEMQYVMLVFRRSLDWTAALDHFGIERVQDPLYSSTRVVGVGRVIDGAEYLRKLRSER